MTLSSAGAPISEETLRNTALTPGLAGALRLDLDSAVRRLGYVAYPVTSVEEILREIRGGRPVLVLQNLGLAWIPVWHYAVVTGFDRDEQVLFLHTGSEADRALPSGLFSRTWSRGGQWARLILPPDALPTGADEERYVTAVRGLERTQRWSDAETAYTTALDRWPNSRMSWLGLGNTRYRQGDLQGAERAFRQAAASGDFPAALNNLALVMAELGRVDEAAALARRAIAGGGPLVAEFTRTLESIEKMRRERPLTRQGRVD